MRNNSQKAGCMRLSPASHCCQVRHVVCTNTPAAVWDRPAASRAARTCSGVGVNPGCMVRVSARLDNRALKRIALDLLTMMRRATFHVRTWFRIAHRDELGAGRACGLPTILIRQDRLSGGAGYRPCATGMGNSFVPPKHAARLFCRNNGILADMAENNHVVGSIGEHRAFLPPVPPDINRTTQAVGTVGANPSYDTPALRAGVSNNITNREIFQHFELLTRLPAGGGGLQCASHELNYTRNARKRKNFFELFFGGRGYQAKPSNA